MTASTRTWNLGEAPWAGVPVTPRCRVIIDNDFSGDPDDLFQLAHHLLSTSVEVVGVVCSHLAPGDPMDPSERTATNAAAIARELFDVMGCRSTDVIVAGAEHGLADRRTPTRSEATDLIIREAVREDTDLPLVYAAGGGLTDLASACLLEPAVARRVRLLWIGGNEHPGTVCPPPGVRPGPEYNLNIDVVAAQVLFGHGGPEIWQFSRDVYRQCLVGDAELRTLIASRGALGRYLYDAVLDVRRRMAEHGVVAGETYALGDQPLVLATALLSQFEPDASSSTYEERACPDIADDGSYLDREGGRPLRVYRQVDTRLMLGDMVAKLAEFEAWRAS